MTYKWVRKSFLIAISFLMFGLILSCRGPSNSTNKEDAVVTFNVTPSDGGKIIATVAGKSIESGANVKKESEVVFTLVPEGNYIIDKWDGEGVKVDSDNSFVARLKVSQDVTVQARLKTTTDPELKLHSLKMYHKDVNITNLSDVKIEVENYVKEVNPNNVEATFTYGTQTTPKKIDVKLDKNQLGDGETVVRLSVLPLAGSYRYWSQEVKITRKAAPEPEHIHPDARVETIEVALLTSKKASGQYKYEDYALVNGFEADSSGPYTAKDAKTAYIAVRVKVEKPSGLDYKIELTNTTTYMSPMKFSRGSAENASYFILKKVPLSKGYNILEIKVKSPDNTEEGKYTVTLKYDGGPDPSTLKMTERNRLPGVYCAAQRKPLEGESPDYIWMIGIAGW